MLKRCLWVITLTCGLILSLTLPVESLDLPSFGSAFEFGKEFDDIKKKVSQFGSDLTNISHVTAVLTKIKADYIPNFNEIQKNPNDSCLYLVKNWAAKVMPARFECMAEIPHHILLTEAKWTTEIQPCFGKCVGMKLKILTQEGTLNLDYTRQFVNEVVPSGFMNYTASIVEECQGEILAIKGNDTNCESHREAIKCVSVAISRFAMDTFKQCPDVPDGWKRLFGADKSQPEPDLIKKANLEFQ